MKSTSRKPISLLVHDVIINGGRFWRVTGVYIGALGFESYAELSPLDAKMPTISYPASGYVPTPADQVTGGPPDDGPLKVPLDLIDPDSIYRAVDHDAWLHEKDVAPSAPEPETFSTWFNKPTVDDYDTVLKKVRDDRSAGIAEDSFHETHGFDPLSGDGKTTGPISDLDMERMRTAARFHSPEPTDTPVGRRTEIWREEDAVRAAAQGGEIWRRYATTHAPPEEIVYTLKGQIAEQHRTIRDLERQIELLK